jgi:hypothetical protein
MPMTRSIRTSIPIARVIARVIAHAIACVIAPAILMAVSWTHPLGAQAPNRRVGNVPREVSREAVALYNLPTTKRVRGDLTMTSADTVRGDVTVLNGTARIGGVITGQLLVINGDAVLSATARIDGSLTVIGGTFESVDRPMIAGEIRVWSARLRYREDADTLVTDLNGELFTRWARWQRDDPNGAKSQFFLTSAHTYNRVEGLPVYLGPRLRVRNGDTRVEAELFGIFRTSSQLNFVRENLGHRVRLELRQGRGSGFLVGTRLFDEVDAVENWQLSDREVGMASFLATRDYRDYWQRHGAQGYVGVFGAANTELRAAFGRERWSSRRMHDVQSLYNSDVAWRNNPRSDDGVMDLFTLTGKLDTRNRADTPRSGWLLKGDYEHGRGTIEAVAPTTENVRNTARGAVSYGRALLDLRRYNRVGPSAQLNVRVVAGGWVGGDALPLQRRVAVSGLDALPGFDFRQTIGLNDVGTCATGSSTVYAALGRPAQCERMVLLQGEWKGDFRLNLFGNGAGFGDRRWMAGRFRADGAWVLFANSGRGWLVRDGSGDQITSSLYVPGLRTWRTDVGGGLDFGSFGVYAAQAISQSTLSPNVYVRLGHRF